MHCASASVKKSQGLSVAGGEKAGEIQHLEFESDILCLILRKNQAVARIADRTASQHLWGSRVAIGHVIT